MSIHQRIRNILNNTPDGLVDALLEDDVQREIFVDAVATLCEEQYVAGGEMRKKLLRIQLGLGVESDG